MLVALYFLLVFSFTLWSVPDFLLDVHYFCSLLVNRYFLVIDCCFLLIACYSLLVGLYFLLVTFYSLLVTFYCFSFLSARCMLLVFLLVASYFFRYIFFFALVFTYFAYLTIQRKIDGHVLNCLLWRCLLFWTGKCMFKRLRPVKVWIFSGGRFSD